MAALNTFRFDNVLMRCRTAEPLIHILPDKTVTNLLGHTAIYRPVTEMNALPAQITFIQNEYLKTSAKL